MPIHPSWTDLSKVLSEISPVLSTEAEAAGVALRVRCDGDNGASVDGDRIKQLVHNLVRNAIEAVGSGGHVEVRSQQKGREVLLEVEDDGPGLAAPAITVFEPFFTTKPSGTGLGLSIVHRIVSDHGGTIQVQSRPGQTVFAVSLPKGQ